MRTLPEAPGSNAGASFASKSKRRAAQTGMAGESGMRALADIFAGLPP